MSKKKALINIDGYGSGWGIINMKDLRFEKIRFTDFEVKVKKGGKK